MVFSSIPFLFFYLPGVLLCYYIAPRRGRNAALFLLSLLFYGWGEPAYLGVMLFSTALDYACGYLAGKYRVRRPRCARAAVACSVAGNLGLLGFFKYADFILEGLRALPGLSGLPPLGLALPAGISFYTFQSMSYTIDVYRGDAPAQRSILDFGAYIALFPQLIAGPIVRYQEIAAQLGARRESADAFAQGVARFAIGLGKKVLLANPFGQLWALYHTQPPAALSTLGAWVGLLAFALQIYFDFSGYSDMAVGLGRMFGFAFPENFRYPYTARSVTEFWRRWHITLSAWFRAYVYIPLGGNRRGALRTCRNLLLVWALTGLWHGASWNFLAWGLYFGLLLALEKAFLLRLVARAPRWAGHAYAMLLVLCGWALFAIETLPGAFAYLRVLLCGGYALADARAWHGLAYWLPLLVLGLLGATPLPARLYARFTAARPRWAQRAAPALCLLLLTLCTAYLVDASYNPFLYFRF